MVIKNCNEITDSVIVRDEPLSIFFEKMMDSLQPLRKNEKKIYQYFGQCLHFATVGEILRNIHMSDRSDVRLSDYAKAMKLMPYTALWKLAEAYNIPKERVEDAICHAKDRLYCELDRLVSVVRERFIDDQLFFDLTRMPIDDVLSEEIFLRMSNFTTNIIVHSDEVFKMHDFNGHRIMLLEDFRDVDVLGDVSQINISASQSPEEWVDSIIKQTEQGKPNAIFVSDSHSVKTVDEITNKFFHSMVYNVQGIYFY